MFQCNLQEWMFGIVCWSEKLLEKRALLREWMFAGQKSYQKSVRKASAVAEEGCTSKTIFRPVAREVHFHGSPTLTYQWNYPLQPGMQVVHLLAHQADFELSMSARF